MVFSRKPLIWLVVSILVLGVALAGFVTPVQAAITPEDDCEIYEGGTIGGNS